MNASAPLVLAVDDDLEFLETLTLVLESRGYRVATATSGEEAFARLEQMPRPSVILLDLMMPGMHGWAFRERQLARPELAEIPVVVLSGDHLALRGMAPSDKQACLAKPVDLNTLLDTVARYCAPPA